MKAKTIVKYPTQLSKICKLVWIKQRHYLYAMLEGDGKTYRVVLCDSIVEGCIKLDIWLDLSKWKDADKFIDDTHLLLDPIKYGTRWHFDHRITN